MDAAAASPWGSMLNAVRAARGSVHTEAQLFCAESSMGTATRRSPLPPRPAEAVSSETRGGRLTWS